MKGKSKKAKGKSESGALLPFAFCLFTSYFVFGLTLLAQVARAEYPEAKWKEIFALESFCDRWCGLRGKRLR